MDSPLALSGLTLGTKVGLEVIGNAGTFQFRKVNFAGANDVTCDACTGACSLCSMLISGTPSEYSVHLSGVTNDQCGSCVTSYDDMTFILPPYGTATEYNSRQCLFYLQDGDAACSIPIPDLSVMIGGITSSSVVTRLSINGDGDWDFGRTANACNETLVETSGVNFWGAGDPLQQCDWSACTATITPNMA